MTYLSDRAVAELSSAALLKNYEAIRQQLPNQAILPMVKANAYGHGAGWVAKHYLSLPQFYGLGVASLDEGAELRRLIGLKWRKTVIIVFADTAPWSEEKGQFCELHGLTATISSDADWALFLRGGWTKRVPYHLQFNTGMNRLGISLSLVRSIAKQLKTRPSDQHPQGIFSHLAMSEQPDSRLSQLQLEKFKVVRKELHSAFGSTLFHLSNSGGIWNHQSFQLNQLTDMVRPGLSLYGIPPWPSAPQKGLCPVLTLRACVIAVHRLKPGDSIGYGGAFRVRGEKIVYAAILGAGYADGVSRALSNRGFAWLGGKSCRFIGNVSMDLCSIRCFPETRVGQWVELLGPRVDAWAQAQEAGTIPYELFTSLSSRVRRVYVE